MNYDRGTRNPQASNNTGLTETGYLFVQTDATQKIVMAPNQLVVKAGNKIYLNFGYDVGNGRTGADLGCAKTGDTGGEKKPTFGADTTKTAKDFAEKYAEVTGIGTIVDELTLGAAINDEVVNQTMFYNLKAAYMRLYPADCYEFVASSAIVAAPGPDTGEMLVAYPQTTAHSVEVAPEEMKMQMRKFFYKCPFQS